VRLDEVSDTDDIIPGEPDMVAEFIPSELDDTPHELTESPAPAPADAPVPAALHGDAHEAEAFQLWRARLTLTGMVTPLGEV
jgi:hypothetical protein